MKTLKTTLFIIALITLFSCSKSNPIVDVIDDDNPIGDNFFVKATIDGINFINDDNDATAFTVVTGTDGVPFASFSGEFSETQDVSNIISVFIKGFQGTGTYTIADFEGSSLSYVITDLVTATSEVWFENSAIGGTGVVNVTQYGGGTASGTFSFTGVNPIDKTEVEITNGEFHLLLVN